MTLAPSRPTADRDADARAEPTVTVLTDRCAGCQECVVRCPTGALGMDQARWVARADSSLCVGCRQCVRTCPFSAIDVGGPMLVAERSHLVTVSPTSVLGDLGETRQGLRSWDEALVEAARCLDCPDPTCVRGCPTHNDIPGFVRALAARDLDEAHRVLRRTSVLPDVCSRVCDQALQCEGSCSWSLAGGRAVAIGALERFVTDQAAVPPPAVAPRHRHDDRPGAELDVAVVGAGPAGIAAAWELVEAGAHVTVYEKAAKPGGLLDWGIPDFTLPSAVADRPWAQLVEAGVELRCGSAVSPDDLDRLVEEHDAVLLAHGAGVPVVPQVPGVDLEGVEDASAFLGRAHVALTTRTRLSDLDAAAARRGAAAVLVLGAGNTAMDVARSARRLGARAVCVDWMDERFAPVRPDELDEARAEGVEVLFSSTVVALDGADGHVARAVLARTRQERRDRRPDVLADETSALEVDLVVLAMGYRMDQSLTKGQRDLPFVKAVEDYPDRRVVASGILASPAPPFARHQPVGRLALARESARVAAGFARAERVWVAGDALVGPSTVVEAMAQGKTAAAAILEHQPRRPGVASLAPRHVVLVVDSVGGHTRSVATTIAGVLATTGACIEVCRVEDATRSVLAHADLLVVGTWTEGLVVAKVGPSRATRAFLATLPPLTGVRAVAFCTFGVSPKGTLAAISQALEAQGAEVVASAAFGPGKLTQRAEVFARSLRSELWPDASRNGAERRGILRAVER